MQKETVFICVRLRCTGNTLHGVGSECERVSKGAIAPPACASDTEYSHRKHDLFPQHSSCGGNRARARIVPALLRTSQLPTKVFVREMKSNIS